MTRHLPCILDISTQIEHTVLAFFPPIALLTTAIAAVTVVCVKQLLAAQGKCPSVEQ